MNYEQRGEILSPFNIFPFYFRPDRGLKSVIRVVDTVVKDCRNEAANVTIINNKSSHLTRSQTKMTCSM